MNKGFIKKGKNNMKKLLTLTSVLVLAACGQTVKYQETGLLCEDAKHNSKNAQITLDVTATDTTANIVVNGENIALTAEAQQEGSNMIAYYGTNANNEKVKLNIVLPTEEGQEVKYMLGVNSDETTYGCVKKVEEPAKDAVAK